MRGRTAVLAVAALLVLSCESTPVPPGPVARRPARYPPTAFAVLSDLHGYDRALGDTGAAFERYLNEDRKLLRESVEILDAALGLLDGTDARFVLVAGDMTKDGEESSHRIVIDRLAAMERSGRQVWVVPGNHDVLNPNAVRFLGDVTEPVKHLDEEEFAAMYADFGYGQALERDAASLSYLAQPVEGLWLLALASTDYSRNLETGHPETDGRLEPATLDWIVDVLGRAQAEGKAVMVLLHHGLVAHFASQQKYFDDFLLDGADGVARLLARAGASMAFTGHFHAQDIALRRWEDGTFLYDIETGSLATWPSPIRLVQIQPDGSMRVETRTVDVLPFAGHARETAHAGIAGIAVEVMVDLGMSRAESETLSGQIADAFVAHYAGDERFEGDEMLKLRGLSLMGRLVVGTRKQLILDLWDDPEPPDRDITVRLDTGAWSSPGAAE